MSVELPEWYPLANATEDEIDGWLKADVPPYDEMQRALPWLKHPHEFDTWISGVREGNAANIDYGRLLELFPGIGSIPKPPRWLAGNNQ
jgi:hypothetical protein